MRKFTSLMLMLLCAVSTWAAATDLPEMSTGETIKWYTIKNVRKQKFATYAGDNATMTQQATASAASFFYFTASTTEGAVKIHNYAAGEKLCAAYNSWTEGGRDWYLAAQATGVSICTSNGEWDAWNDARGEGQMVEYWSASDAGSAWAIELVTDFTSIIDVPAAKAAAIAELNTLAVVSTIYPAATEAVAAVEAVEAAGTGLAELNAAIESIDAIVADYKTAAYQALSGKYYTIETLTKDRDNGFMQMAASNVVGTATANSPANIWQFVENNGKVNIYNPYTGKYLCEPQGNSAEVAVTTDQAAAGAYDLAVNNVNPENQDAKIKFTSNAKSVHMAGNSTLVRWDNGGASEWQVVMVDNFTSIIDAYKAATIATLDQWATLSVVFDASLIAGAKAAINGINTTDYATFAAIDAEIVKVTDAVAAKMFTFQTLATDNHRENVWVSANPSTGKAIGLHGEHNYNSIWSLRHAGGVSFYMFNELNQVYMGKPSANCPLTENASVAYTFEIIDAANGVVEMKCDGETLHASNHTDDKLLSWDGDEAASRWYIRTIDVAADIQAILDVLTEDDYADVPALGQYTTAAYEALVAARTSAKTVEEVEHAIAAFNKAKNRPVFTIDGVISYAAGKSVYDDQNGAPNFKATNLYDKTMWWVFDQTTTTVGVTESVDVINYATGNGFWGAEALKITDTSDANENDDIFLFYTVGNGTPLHYQDANQTMTRWSSTESTSGSATKFTYIGNTYDLDKLTAEKIAALSALKSAYDEKAGLASAELGNALGQYSAGNIDAIVAAEAAAKNILNSALAAQAALEISAINAAAKALNDAAATLVINMPTAGKYYRIQGACEASLAGYYITGHTNEDGGRIALTDVADASTIYYFDGTNLIAYQSGLVVGLNANHWTFASIEDNSKPASTIVFAQSPRTAGAYTVKSADRYFHYTVYNNTVQVNRCSTDDCKEHDWYLTEVTELPVTIGAAGYATFFTPVEVSYTGIEAYTASSIEGGYVKMADCEGVIPAGEGVILKGNEGAYELTINYEGTKTVETNILAGTAAKTKLTEVKDYYILSIVEDAVGFYKDSFEGNWFQNNSHKAYLAVEATQGALSYGFDFGGTTAIEGIEAVAGEQAIYDLTGRKIEAITVPGLYIINGVKTIVE